MKTTARQPVTAIWVIWITGFCIGTASHVLDLAQGRQHTYSAYPLAARAFWFSLTVLDPLTVALLLMRRRPGILLGLGVILVDIGVNWPVTLICDNRVTWGVVNQSIFALLLLLTCGHLWRWFGQHKPAPLAGAPD